MLSLLALHALALVGATTSDPSAQDAVQGFLFSYSTNPLNLPIISSCPGTLTIPSPGSLSSSEAADPVPPYTFTMLVHEQLMDGAGIRYERMYAKSVDVGSMQNGWSTSVPWMNGTQMIGCMSSGNGVSGGCQDLVTVVSTADTAAAYAYPNSTCRIPSVMGAWVPPPSQTLSVKVEHPVGELASNGWPLSCTDIRVTPLNGTAPYSLLVAPAYHPPLQFSGNGAMNYTVRLSHGQAFMLGLFDANGNSWAYGPLHAGHNDDVSCLGVNNGQTLPSRGGFGVGVLAGGVVGAFVVGAVGAALLLWGCCLRGSRRRRMHQPLRSPMDHDLDPTSPFSPPVHRSTSNNTRTSLPTGTATPAGRSQYDLYLNPKPYDPYADSPELTSAHHLSYISARSADSPNAAASGTVGGSGELYDPYRASRQRDSAASGSRLGQAAEGSNTWPRAEVHSGNLNRNSGPMGEFGENRSGYSQAQTGSTSNLHTRHAGHSRPDRDLTASRSRSPSSPYQHQQARQSFNPDRYPEHSPPLSEREQHRFRSSSDVRDALSSSSRQSRRDISPERASVPRNVYIVHSEAGPEHDVHIRLPPSERDSRVIEMPPDYRPGSWASARSADGQEGVRDSKAPRGDGGAPGTAGGTRGRERSKSELERMQAEYLGLGQDQDR